MAKPWYKALFGWKNLNTGLVLSLIVMVVEFVLSVAVLLVLVVSMALDIMVVVQNKNKCMIAYCRPFWWTLPGRVGVGVGVGGDGESSNGSKLAQSKKLELGWLGSAQRQSQNPSLAWLGLKHVLIFQAELGSGSKKIGISKLSWARAQGKLKFQAWPS